MRCESFGSSPVERLPTAAMKTRSVQLADGSQEFLWYPLALPVVEVGWFDVVSQEMTDPQLAIVPDWGENIRAAIGKCHDTPPSVRQLVDRPDR